MITVDSPLRNKVSWVVVSLTKLRKFVKRIDDVASGSNYDYYYHDYHYYGLISYDFLGFHMISYDFLWISMDFYGF